LSAAVALLLLFFKYSRTRVVSSAWNEEHVWAFIRMFGAYLIMAAIIAVYEYSRTYSEKILSDRADDLAASRDKLKLTLVDLNKLNDDLRRLNAIKSEFTAMVSHELRTPLTAIIQGVKIVLDEKAGKINDEQRSFLEITNRNIERLSRLVNDVLDFQKLDTGRMSFYMRKTDLNEVVLEVANDMSNLASVKFLRVETDPSPGVTAAVFDKDKIIQVLTNLLSNAIKYTSEGSITISIRKENENAVVSVKDTGIGISREDATKLFTSFTQLDHGRERKPRGSGLGLAISRKIIEAHRGKIWVESEIDKGSVFSFSLPLSRKDNVVIISPDTRLLGAAKERLEPAGFRVILMEDGIKALEFITRSRPDIIVLDMEVNDISGVDFIDRLCGIEELSSIPVLVMATVAENKAMAGRYKDKEGLLYLIKPFDSGVFHEKVERILKGRS